MQNDVLEAHGIQRISSLWIWMNPKEDRYLANDKYDKQTNSHETVCTKCLYNLYNTNKIRRKK